MIRNKKWSISVVLIIIFVILVWLWWYAYYNGNKAEPNSSLTDKITGWLTKVVESVTPESNSSSEELNYKFNFDANFELLNDSKKESFWELKIENWEIITKEKSLKQSIKIWNISWKLKTPEIKNWEKQEINFKDFSAIWDNEITYFYTWEWYEKLMEFYKWIYESVKLDLNTINSIEKAYREKKYVKVDNSKPILKVLWELSKNELIKKIAIWLSTTNPKAYYEKIKIWKELKKVFASDFIINYIFKDWEYNEKTKKTFLSINDRICTDAIPVISNIVKEFKLESFIDTSFENECITGIKQVNGFLPMFIQIYKEGDIKSGNYKFVVSQGITLKLEINYKRNILDTYSLDLKDPKNSVSLALSGDKNKLKSSLLKLNIDENWIKINWEIKNWKWKININIWEETENIKWFIEFKKYFVSNYDLEWNSEDWENTFIAKWNYKEGKIRIEWKKQWDKWNFLLEYNKEKFLLDSNAPIWNKFKISYENKKIDLDMDFLNGLKLKSHYEKWKFYYDMVEKNKFTWKITKSKLNYDNWKINWERIYNDNKGTLTWNFKNLEDFDLEFSEEKEKINIKAKSEKISDKETKITVVLKEKDKEKLNVNISRIKWKKDWYKTCEIKWKILSVDDKKEINFNINSSYKKGWVKFEIPKDFEEINITFLEISTLPDFNMVARLKEIEIWADKLVFWAVWVIWWVFVAWMIDWFF